MHRKGKLSGVLHKGFKPDKCKTALRMAVARIKLLRNRKELAVRQMRREVAQLLEANQDQTARIRVEHVIREEKFMQAYDLIEVYCELIVARLSIIDSQKTCPIDLKEAIASVIFASMRCADLTELADVRKHFTSKYGKDFAAAALEVRPDSGVSRLVIEKLSAGAPDAQTKMKTLTSIADEHNIKWEPKAFEEKLQKQNEDMLHGTTAYYGGYNSTMGSSTPSISTPQPTYSGVSAGAVNPGASHVPVGPYSSAEVSTNNAFEEDRRDSKASAPLSSQHGASTFHSAQIPGSNNVSHENSGGHRVSRPYSKYDAPAPVSRDEEIDQHTERKPSMSGANWNIEFKDATSAAQAAAESAEMASIAARAAAQLASRGNYSGEQSTGGFESGAYNQHNMQRKQTAAHSMKDNKRSFNDQSLRTNDPRMIFSDEGKHSAGAETNHLDRQNMSTAFSPSQDVHPHNPETHAYVYGKPNEPPRAHSPEPPHSDDLNDRESNIGRYDRPMDFPGEKVQDTALGGHNFVDVNVSQVSSDHESIDDYYDKYSSSHGAFTHDSRPVWDNQTETTQVKPSSVVFDQYDSDVEEESLFDTFASKHTEQLPDLQDNMESSNAYWSQQQRSDSPSNHRTSDLFSRTETQRSDTLEGNRRDIPAPRSYDNLPPTFDSDGVTSDEEIVARPTTMHAETLRSHSKGSTDFGNSVHDFTGSSEHHYESNSNKKSWTSPGLNVSYKEQNEAEHSPRNNYPRAHEQRNSGNIQSRDSDMSDEESEPEQDELKVMSSSANENQSLPFAMQTSAKSNDKNEGHSGSGLNFTRISPGLRNKLKQPPPYPLSSRDNVTRRQSLNKASASFEESIDSEENTSFGKIRSTTKSSRSTKSSGGSYSSELYDRNPSVEAPKEARSTMARNSLNSDDAESLYGQFGNSNLAKTKGSEYRSSSQELYHDKPDIGGRQQMRPKVAKNFFDSDDSEEELELRSAHSKWSAEQIPSRRTREVTSRAKRDDIFQTRAWHAAESERMPRETNATPAFSSSNVVQRERPDVRVRVQQSSTKTEHNESPMAREKLENAELDTHFVLANENTETSTGTPKESTSKTAPAHVHPKLPTDYDSFAAHFKSLRTNPRKV